MGGEVFTLRSEDWRAILDDVERCLPAEACGLVAGRSGHSTGVFPITNELSSPSRFQMSPAEQIRAMWRIEALGWNLEAIYHSHPQGPSGPSHIDVAEAAYPEAISIIVSPAPAGFGARGFRIDRGTVQEITLLIPGSARRG